MRKITILTNVSVETIVSSITKGTRTQVYFHGELDNTTAEKIHAGGGEVSPYSTERYGANPETLCDETSAQRKALEYHANYVQADIIIVSN